MHLPATYGRQSAYTIIRNITHRETVSSGNPGIFSDIFLSEKGVKIITLLKTTNKAIKPLCRLHKKRKPVSLLFPLCYKKAAAAGKSTK